MRTYEDVKEALKAFEDELKRESGIKRDHYIITGGNMSVVRKGVGQYALDKGTPVPMIWETAKKKHEEFQEKCGENLRLEITKYSDWLTKNIEDCKKLMNCMQKSLSGEDTKPETPESQPECPAENPMPDETQQIIPGGVFKGPDGVFREVELSCRTCPIGVKNCMVCRFAVGVETTSFPWKVVCSAPISEKVEKS